MGIFNPSLGAAPANLCPRCAWVAAVRVDPLHQCHEASPLLRPDPRMPKYTAANAWFKGTAIAVLDRDLKVLGWTWLLNAPQHQVSQGPAPSRWFAAAGAADRFPPPWAKSVYDVRIISISSRLFVSYVCRKCAFSVAQLQLTAEHTASGGLTSLRAWQNRRYASTASWAQGRNQALFVAARRKGGPDELMVQPWMGMVASFGAPIFRSQPTVCRKGTARICGATPPGTRLSLERVTNERDIRDDNGEDSGDTAGFGWLELLGNTSHAELSRAAVGGYRLSTTSNLVRVAADASGSCIVHLGVGHVHRSEGELNLRMAMLDELGAGGNRTEMLRRRRARRRRRQQGLGVNGSTTARTFMWGFQYTHFLYALEPHAPFRVIATSREFCVAAEQDASDCESIQFVSGLAVAPGGSTLLLSYGVNDCEAKVSKMPLERVWRMLQPLRGLGGVCGGKASTAEL